jgi:NAD+ synthase
MNHLPIYHATKIGPDNKEILRINARLLTDFLVKFLQEECIKRRSIKKAVIGVSGGVDSSVTAFLCQRAFGSGNVTAFCMPYKLSSPESLDHAKLIIDLLKIQSRTINITSMVDGYLAENEPDASPLRIGNICARARMIVLYDQSAKLHALPIGTGNKTERMFGYFTWHADDAPPINPLGDVFKSQVYMLASYLGVPDVIIKKAPTADLVPGQTDEGDWGISIERADVILAYLMQGFTKQQLIENGFDKKDVENVYTRVATTHWKRHLPTVAMISNTAINEFYLRPVDY